MLLYAVTEVSDVHGIFLSLMAVIFVLAGGPISNVPVVVVDRITYFHQLVLVEVGKIQVRLD